MARGQHEENNPVRRVDPDTYRKAYAQYQAAQVNHTGSLPGDADKIEAARTNWVNTHAAWKAQGSPGADELAKDYSPTRDAPAGLQTVRTFR